MKFSHRVQYINDLLIDGFEYSYVFTDKIISMGSIYGVFREENNKVKIHNKIFEILIYNHLSMQKERSDRKLKKYESSQFINENKDLNIVKIIEKFQELMKCEYSI